LEGILRVDIRVKRRRAGVGGFEGQRYSNPPLTQIQQKK
jgi:hypothetical protein